MLGVRSLPLGMWLAQPWRHRARRDATRWHRRSRGTLCVSHTLTNCVMDLLATSFSSTPPMNTCTVRLVTKVLAICLTSRGQVALQLQSRARPPEQLVGGKTGGRHCRQGQVSYIVLTELVWVEDK